MAMGVDSSVKILELTRVLPAAADPNSPNSATAHVSLPLTFFETFWLKFLPVQRLFFYQLTESSSSPHSFNSVILPNLKHSLSVALRHYLPLAGALTWPSSDPKPSTRYSPGDGVSVTVAESNADFNYLSNNVVHSVADFRPFVPELFTSDDKTEIVSFQITLFPSQGFSVGIASHHALLDGKSSTMFMKSWAYLCRQIYGNKDNQFSSFSLPEELTPVFDKSVIKDSTGIDMIYLRNWFDFTGPGPDPERVSLNSLSRVGSDVSECVRATFELKSEDIKKLRDRVCKNEVEESKSLHLSTFVLTFSYVAVCLAKARGAEENDINFAMLFAADCRRRLIPPIPLNYVGACIRTHIIAAKSTDLNMNGLNYVVKKLSDVIKGFENGVSDGLDEMLVNFIKMLKEGGVPGQAKIIAVSGSNRFNVYGTDFGWGRPKKVENVSIDRRGGAFSMAESRDGSGGVEIGIVLENKEMEIFSFLFADGLKD